MRKTIPVIILAIIALAASGCGKTHPVKVFVAPDYKPAEIEKIAVLPFTSSLHHSEDPDNIAPRMMDQLFLEELDTRSDYGFISPNSVSYAVESAGMSDKLQVFVDDFRQGHQVDVELLKELGHTLQAEAVLVGVVDLWNQDQVDYREASATPTTTVGATITILSLADGKVLFEASDEDFLEGVESTADSRGIRTSGIGSVYSDPGSNVYEAPAHKEVALKVVKALVSSIPLR